MTARLPLSIAPLAAVALAGTLMATPALAQVTVGDTSAHVEGTSTNDYISDRFQFDLGTYIVSSRLKSEFNGNAGGSNVPVDFAHTFGEDQDHSRVRFDGLWRITPKHHVRLVYFNNNVSNSKTIDRDIAWGDYTFQANGTVSSESKLSVGELSYEYAFVRKPNLEVAAGAGVHLLNMSLKLSGEATYTDANGVVQPAAFSSTSSNIPAPLPVIGARATWAVARNIYIEPEVQWLSFHYDAFRGSWWDLRVAAKWMFTRHWGAGIGYDYFHVNVDVDKPKFNGNVKLGYSGGQLMLVGSY